MHGSGSRSYININNNAEAERCYKKALKINPACGRAYHDLFICYDMSHQPEKRKEILEQARQYMGDDIRLKYMEARMANIEKDYERGLSYLNDVEIPADPLGVDILYEAGWMYDRLKDSKKPITCWPRPTGYRNKASRPPLLM